MSIKQLLKNATREDAGLNLLERLEVVVSQLGQTSIDQQARSDIVSIIDDAIELASAMLNQTYPVELVLRRTTNILSTSQRILMHTETMRPGRHAFGAILPTGDLLPFISDTQQEAITQLSRLQALGVSKLARIVPIRISSQYIQQPQLQVVAAARQDERAPRREFKPQEVAAQVDTEYLETPLAPERETRMAEIRSAIESAAQERQGTFTSPIPTITPEEK